MHTAKKDYASAGLLAGVLLTVAGVGSYACAYGPERHDARNDNRASITGSPDELALRARDLGEHMCANIKAASNCPVTTAADAAAKDLSAMQTGYQDGQAHMHGLLTSANVDRDEFAQLQTRQAQAVQASASRYMQFLADAATASKPLIDGVDALPSTPSVRQPSRRCQQRRQCGQQPARVDWHRNQWGRRAGYRQWCL